MQKDGVLQMEGSKFYFITLLKIITYPGRLLMSKKGFKFFIGRDPASFAGKGLFVLL